MVTFPPADRAAMDALMLSDPPFRLDAATVATVYEAAWFLLPGDEPSAAATRWTFEVAATRLHALPNSWLHVPWLVTIADRESRRHRSINQWNRRTNQRYGDSLDDPAQRALHLAEAIGRLDPDRRLALVLTHRLRTPTPAIAAALGIMPDAVPSYVAASEALLAENTPLDPATMAALPVPQNPDLPTHTVPLGIAKRRRSNLNYGWQANRFPTKTRYDNRSRRRVANAIGVVGFIAAAIIGFSSLEPLRPTLEAPVSAATVSTTAVPTTAAPTTAAPTTAAPTTEVPSTGFVLDFGDADLGAG